MSIQIIVTGTQCGYCTKFKARHQPCFIFIKNLCYRTHGESNKIGFMITILQENL